MILTDLDSEEINQIVNNLKDYEIDQCRIKVIKLTNSLKANPNQLLNTVILKITLERLNHLLTT
ncbi:hypothetical protein [Olleya aquimaris]|uniref:Uncharacterized protein n=1 Tax=Olleya aquimaris TaxID=639310 RepID=A0A327RMD0_9FLAO|nr:hypothetical protein [Olleya aquimaris]RAJ17052.1 hypothetical protein LY08_00830 [Olleya aquimaris]